MAWEYAPPKLIKPIFIEENFIAPFFNGAVEEELGIVCEWLKKQPVNETIITNVCEFAKECISLNKRLSEIADFNETAAPIPIEEHNIRADTRIDIYSAVKGKIFINHEAMREVLYCIMREFSTEPFAKSKRGTSEGKYCDFLYWYALEWYSEGICRYDML